VRADDAARGAVSDDVAPPVTRPHIRVGTTPLLSVEERVKPCELRI
jgi:hypothetical protein